MLKFKNAPDINNVQKYVLKYKGEKIVIKYGGNVLIDRNVSEVDTATLYKGLKLVGDYLEKTILKPNNLNQPISRLQFINTIK